MLDHTRKTAVRILIANGDAYSEDHAESMMKSQNRAVVRQAWKLAVATTVEPEDVAAAELAAHAENSRRDRRSQLPPADMSELLDRLTPDEMRRAAEGFLWNCATIGQVLEDRDNVDTLTIIEEDLRELAPTWLPVTSTGQDPVAGRWWADVQGVEADGSVTMFEDQEDEHGGPLDD